MARTLELNLSPERTLLLEVARSGTAWPTAAAVELVSREEFGWKRFLDEARLQRLAGIIHSKLQHPDLGSLVPVEVLEEARQDYLRIMMRGVYFDTELKRILEALAVESIPVILLKGAALKQTVYADPGVRPMSDIDILVPPDTVRSAQDAVMSLGYSENYAAEEIAHAEQFGRHLPRLQSENGITAVEIHRHIVSPGGPIDFPIEGPWERSVEITVDGARAAAFSPEDQLLHLAVNFMLDRRYHAAASLGQLMDIAAVIEHQPVDFTKLRSTIAEYGVEPLSAVAFELAAQLLGAGVPREVRLVESGDSVNRDESAAMLGRFVRARVFPEHDFFATVLPGRGPDGGRGVTIGARWRRVIPTRRYMVGKYGESARGLVGTRFYAVRLAAGLRQTAVLAAHPGAWRDNVLVDRWMASLTRPAQE